LRGKKGGLGKGRKARGKEGRRGEGRERRGEEKVDILSDSTILQSSDLYEEKSHHLRIDCLDLEL
jgi:hypothetical protein